METPEQTTPEAAAVESAAAAPVPAMGPVAPDQMQAYLKAALVVAVPLLIMGAFYLGPKIIVVAVMAGAFGKLAEVVVAEKRGRSTLISRGAFTYGLLVALIIPVDTPLWMVAGASFLAIIFAKEAFGGTGSHVFMPALVCKGFLMFSYPKAIISMHFGHLTAHEDPSAYLFSGIVILLAALVMVRANRKNALVIGSALLAGFATAFGLLQSGVIELPGGILQLVNENGFLIGASLFACDPACSPRNDRAKLMYGLMIGACAMLMRGYSNYAEGMLSAVLVGNLFAPVLDVLATMDMSRRSSN